MGNREPFQNVNDEFEAISPLLPEPIKELLHNINENSNPLVKFQILCLSLIPWTFQYIALILGGEYLSSPFPPEVNVNDSLWTMIKRPGPGKYLGFIREVSHYFMDKKLSVIPEEAITQLMFILENNSINKVQIPESKEKINILESLVNIRNKFAHSKGFSNQKAKELYDSYLPIWKAMIIALSEIFKPILFFKNSSGQYVAFNRDQLFLSEEIENPQSTLLFNGQTKMSIPLFPIVITEEVEESTQDNALILEEVRNKNLFYLNKDGFLKRKEEFSVLMNLIDSKKIQEKQFTASELTIKEFAARIDRLTKNTLMDYKDTLKYIPEMFFPRKHCLQELDQWMDSVSPACILVGEPGTGKTSVVAHWSEILREQGNHVLLIEASKLHSSNISNELIKLLNLKSSLKECLDAIHNQILQGEKKKFIVIIDAVNEFIGSENDNRSFFWRHIDKLVTIFNLYTPHLKCLVTTRNDIWKDDFPGKNEAAKILERENYWGQNFYGFPVITLGKLEFDELRDIYENARKNIPSMQVQTPFDELSIKSQKVLTNPFLLRIALTTYNGKTVPNVSKSQILKAYSYERMTREAEKKKLLFMLLEKMSELKKTDISIEELLNKEAVEDKKKTMEIEELEKNILNPRAESPYKELIHDGIIEEYNKQEMGVQKEFVAFTQEKITHIIYSEFQKQWKARFLKKALIWLTLVSLFTVVICSVLSVKLSHFNTELTNNIYKLEISGESKTIITGMFTEFISEVKNSVNLKLILLIAFTYLFAVIMIFFLKTVRDFGSRIIRMDLPMRFTKEKFNEFKHRKIEYFNSVIYGYVSYLFIRGTLIASKLSLEEGFGYIISKFVFIVFLVFCMELSCGIYIVLTHARIPEMAFSLFGPKEVMHTIINGLPIIIIVPLVFFMAEKGVYFMDISNERIVLQQTEKIMNNKTILELKEENPAYFKGIQKIILKLKYFGRVKKLLPQYEKFSLMIWKAIAIVLPGILFLEFILAYILRAVLRKKLQPIDNLRP